MPRLKCKTCGAPVKDGKYDPEEALRLLKDNDRLRADLKRMRKKQDQLEAKIKELEK